MMTPGADSSTGCLGLVIVVLFIAVLFWVVGDAQARGKSGGLAFLLVLLLGPIGLIAWLLFRPSKPHVAE
jgi:hypothetical protein